MSDWAGVPVYPLHYLNGLNREGELREVWGRRMAEAYRAAQLTRAQN